MNENYKKLATPPKESLKPIGFGKLKGKFDINPQWKIEAMTEVYGTVGVGWKFEIAETKEVALQDGRIMLFMRVDVSVKDGDKWGEPTPGWGGDFIVNKNKNGMEANDEAYKMACTDALGNALKCFGVAADVYRGLCDTKYGKQEEQAKPQQKQESKPITKQEQGLNSVTKPVRFTADGRKCEIRANNEWQNVENLSVEALNWVLSKENYSAAHDACRAILNTRSVK